MKWGRPGIFYGRPHFIFGDDPLAGGQRVEPVQNGGSQVSSSTTMGAANTTLYAHWKVSITFRDVSSSTPHSADIAWAAESGISTDWIESDGSRTFRGMDTVKRQDMAAFLRREAVRMGVAVFMVK